MTIDEETRALREFLLGIESERDGEEIGVRLISDPDFAASVEFAEETLIEQFLDGHLSEKERGLFLQNFLTTVKRTELLEEIAALRTIARSREILSPDAADAADTVERRPAAGFFSSLTGVFGLKLAAAGVVILLLTVGIWRFGFSEPGFNDLEKSFATINEKDLNNSALTDGLTSQSLLYRTLRGDSGVKLNGAALSESVFFSLALPPGISADARFDLELRRSGDVVFRQKGLKYYQNPNGAEVKVIVPRAVLQKGSYQLKLGTDISYAFLVE